jgi:hypothetical protein
MVVVESDLGRDFGAEAAREEALGRAKLAIMLAVQDMGGTLMLQRLLLTAKTMGRMTTGRFSWEAGELPKKVKFTNGEETAYPFSSPLMCGIRS